MMVPQKEHSKTDQDHTLYVGIGASAGGVEPLKTFIASLPEQTSMIFIVIMHLSPEHSSNLNEILQSKTSLKVLQVEGKTKLKPNHIYIIPPNKRLLVGDNHLELKELQKRDHRPQVIDQFFRSLGNTKGNKTASILLSGTGSDGTAGIRKIKEKGGLIIAQQPEEAQYSDMPQRAIDSGIVERVLPVSEMAQQLIDYKEGMFKGNISEDPESLSEEQEHALSGILTKLRNETDHDFHQYKQSTLLRRIDRRMHVRRAKTLEEYLSVIEDDPQEVQELFKDLLISVTSFFRDPEAFEALKSEVIPKLFEDKHRDDQLRIWVPGCATGEEAYSIAMLLYEYAEGGSDLPEFKIFATDIDEQALQAARNGRYPESISSDISDQRLERFFIEKDAEYQVRDELSDIILFTKHDMLINPPFSELDLISCRNFLIYLRRELQAEVFNLFHYALRSRGFLFLGSSDSNLEANELFDPFNQQYCIFRQSSKTRSRAHLPDFPLRFNKKKFSGSYSAKTTSDDSADFKKLYERLIQRSRTTTGVVVNKNQEVLHAGEGIDQYLKYSSGEPSSNILDMVIPEMRHTLRSIFFQTQKEDQELPIRKNIRPDDEKTPQLVELTLQDVMETDFPDDLYFLVFKKIRPEKSDIHKKIAVNEAVSDEEVEIIDELEKELAEVREELQVTVEDYETSNEELRSSNEELQSMNEELQSTTEELETSQEELYSVNEELKTVNQELETKIDELSEANDDLKNLMEATEVAILFVDFDLRLQRFTDSVGSIFNIIQSDVGRPLDHLTNNLVYDGVLEDVQQVISEGGKVKKTVSTQEGRCYMMRVRGYQTTKGENEGVVISFVDITELTESQQELESKIRQQEALAQLGLYALSGKAFEKVVERVMQVICDIFEADYVLLLEYDHEKNTLHLKKEIGFQSGYPKNKEFEIKEKWAAGYSFANKQSVIVEDFDEDERFDWHFITSDLDVTSGINVIVQGTEEAYGVLEMYTAEKRRFTERDVSFLQIVTNLIAETIHRKKTEKELEIANEDLQQQVTQSEHLQREILNNSLAERWQLGQYLHDNLGQVLAAAKITINDIEQKAPDQEFTIDISHLKELIDKSMADIRNLSHDLIPVDVEEEGFEYALRLLIRQSEELHNIQCTLEAENVAGEIKNRKVATHLYHIVQEAIKNGVTHGEADKFRIYMSREEKHLRFRIEDDGIGLSSTGEDTDGQGLRIIEHRVDLMGGNFAIEEMDEEKEGRTCLNITIPLSRLAKENEGGVDWGGC